MRQTTPLTPLIYETMVALTDAIVFPNAMYAGGIPSNHHEAVMFYFSGTSLSNERNSMCVVVDIISERAAQIERELHAITSNTYLRESGLIFNKSPLKRKEHSSSHRTVIYWFRIMIDGDYWLIDEYGNLVHVAQLD